MAENELELLTEILENLEDEGLAVSLLNELNAKSKNWGQLIQNTDPSIKHEEWKKLCDEAEQELKAVKEKIFGLK